MNKQPPGAVRKQPPPRPGRVYAFLVIALATFVLGLGVGPPAGAATGASAAPTDLAAPAEQPPRWTRPQLAMRMGVALLLGTVGGWLAGRSSKRRPEPIPVAPQQVEQVTELPIIGTIFHAPMPAKPSASGSRLSRWIIFSAELVLMLAVMLSFHAAVTHPTFARRFAQNPFAAYTQSVHDWQNWVDSTL